MIVALYLAAVVGANLTVAAFGPAWSVVNAFVFIGFDLTSRDRLHREWHGNGLVWKMALLIAAGGAISWALNADAAQIAVASTISFVLSAIVDTLVFQGLRGRSWMAQVNGSNVASAAVDSIVFPTLAFGALLPFVVAGQFAAKVGGGYVWSRVLRRAVPVRQAG